MQTIKLSDLAVGECCLLQKLELCDATRRYLKNIGLYPGATAKCVHIAPAGSPIALYFMGSVFALRRSMCQMIEVVKIEC